MCMILDGNFCRCSFSHDLSDYIEMDDLDIFTLPGLDTSVSILKEFFIYTCQCVCVCA